MSLIASSDDYFLNRTTTSTTSNNNFYNDSLLMLESLRNDEREILDLMEIRNRRNLIETLENEYRMQNLLNYSESLNKRYADSLNESFRILQVKNKIP